MRILVVDDDAAVRESLGRALRLEGYDVEMAADGREPSSGFRETATTRFVVLDVLMPNVDGLEVAGGCGEREAGCRC
jgi:two-component system response regulator MprA